MAEIQLGERGEAAKGVRGGALTHGGAHNLQGARVTASRTTKANTKRATAFDVARAAQVLV